MSHEHEDEPKESLDRSILDAARPALGPSANQRARLRRSVAVAIATGAVAAGSGPAVQASFGFGKVGLVLGGLLGVGALGAWWSSTLQPARPSPPDASVMAPDAAPQLPPDAGVDAPDDAAASGPDARVRPTRVQSVPSPDSVDESGRFSSIEAESQLISEAHRALRSGQGQQALEVLAQHAARFPSGALSPERMVLRVLAECEVGDLVGATRHLASALEHGGPAARSRLRTSCVGGSVD